MRRQTLGCSSTWGSYKGLGTGHLETTLPVAQGAGELEASHRAGLEHNSHLPYSEGVRPHGSCLQLCSHCQALEIKSANVLPVWELWVGFSNWTFIFQVEAETCYFISLQMQTIDIHLAPCWGGGAVPLPVWPKDAEAVWKEGCSP